MNTIPGEKYIRMCSSHVMHLLINSDFFSHAVFPVVQSVSPVTLWEVKWTKLVKISISPCFSCTMGRRIGHFLLTLACKLPGTSMYGHICGEARICTRCTRSTAVSGFVSIPFCRGHRCCNWPSHFLHIFPFPRSPAKKTWSSWSSLLESKPFPPEGLAFCWQVSWWCCGLFLNEVPSPSYMF